MAQNPFKLQTRVNILAKRRGRNKEKVGEKIRNFGQNIYPRYQLLVCTDMIIVMIFLTILQVRDRMVLSARIKQTENDADVILHSKIVKPTQPNVIS